MSKKFLITIDTEGDNQWDATQRCSTENAKYIKRFQELCEKYDFKPTWLTNYEMAKDPFFVEYITSCLNRGTCEVGMHLHAWNNPPEYELNRSTTQRDYLYEYPEDIMDEKIHNLTLLLESTFNCKMVSHRSGRWATNEKYFEILEKYGYKVDCSVTPHVNWSNTVGATGKAGSDYSSCQDTPYYIHGTILEIPVSIEKVHCFCKEKIHGIIDIAREGKHLLCGKYEWLRPEKNLAYSAMKAVVNSAYQEKDYVMFMLHSSELMPGGSPSFPTQESIEQLYECMDKLFAYIKQKGYEGKTVAEYATVLEK